MDYQAATVDVFAKSVGLSSQAVSKHMEELERQGAYRDDDGRLLLPYGTRKHYNLGRTKPDKPGMRYYTILKATSTMCFVDASVIGVLPEEFDAMVDALVKAGLLIPSGIDNEHGANGYLSSPKGDSILENRAQKAAKTILEAVSVVISAGGLAVQLVTL